jgi:hypothetical protein
VVTMGGTGLGNEQARRGIRPRLPTFLAAG